MGLSPGRDSSFGGCSRFLRFVRFGTDQRQSSCWSVDAVAALEAVSADYLRGLNQFPNVVFAGSRESGVVHEWISEVAGLATAVFIIRARAAIGHQLE